MAMRRVCERRSGRRASLPLLSPGKTVRIATLPGLDPDDIIRQQGRDAFADVIDRARSLNDVVWSLETGGVVPETPRPRAALEVRLRERANGIADQSVRRHYMQAFDEKPAGVFPSGAVSSGITTREAVRGRGRRQQYGQQSFGNPRLVVSDTLRNSRL